MGRCPEIELSADARVLFQQGDGRALAGQMDGGGQSANPAAYDHHAFAHFPRDCMREPGRPTFGRTFGSALLTVCANGMIPFADGRSARYDDFPRKRSRAFAARPSGLSLPARIRTDRL